MGATRLDGAIALVTGGSSGIGTAVARALAAAGARLFVTGRDPDRLAEAGRIDVLVNNAGQGWAGPLHGMTDTEITDLVAVNLTAPMVLTRAALPGMLAHGHGHLGFVGSIAGRLGVREEAAYSAAKAGLGVFTDSLRQELTGSGVVVTELVPAVVETRFFARRGRPYQRRFPRPVPADRAADVLLAAMLAGRDEAYLPGWLRLPVAVRAALPGTYRKLAARFG